MNNSTVKTTTSITWHEWMAQQQSKPTSDTGYISVSGAVYFLCPVLQFHRSYIIMCNPH